MANGSEFLPAFNFRVEIEGILQGGLVTEFQEVSGLVSESDVIEYRAGGSDRIIKVPGIHKVGDITLKRGSTASNELWEWRNRIQGGVLDKKAMSIILLNQEREEAQRWNVYEAWPRKLVLPSLNASQSEIAVEEMVLACERIELA